MRPSRPIRPRRLTSKVRSTFGIRSRPMAWRTGPMSLAQQMTPQRGDVVMVNLDPTVGHEQGGQRPALVVSDDSLNRSPAGVVIVAPITGTDRNIPAHVRVTPPEGGL